MQRVIILFLAIVFVGNCQLPERNKDIREKQLFDFNWYFHEGDREGAHRKNFEHSSWQKVDLPHDWSIEGEYSRDRPVGRRGGFLPMGIGWYRKSFEWDPAWEGKKVKVHFDGIYMNSEVWINGHYLGKRPNGYVSFQYDLTPYLTEGENVLAVKVDNSKVPSGRWYTGSGIYRHVWLKIHNPVHIPQWGVFVKTPKVSDDSATVHVQTDVVNGESGSRKLTLETHFVDPAGDIRKKVRKVKTVDSTARFEQSTVVKNPELWSPENPEVYRAISYVKRNGAIVDSLNTVFGIRRLEFSAEEGFKLNEEKTIIKGVSNHQDGGGAVGIAVPEDTRYRRLKMLKEMGCNAIRTAHHPFATEFYNMCDTMGILVLADAMDGWRHTKAKYDYGLYFEDWWKKDMTNFVRRTRNHPCVFMYCLGNEVRGYASNEQKMEDRKSLVSLFQALDGTRPVTQANIDNPAYLDVMGFNGNGEEKGVLEEFHRNYHDMPAIGTEMTHTLQTRGIYRTQTWYRGKDNPTYAHIDWHSYKSKVYKVPDLTDEEIFPEKDWRYSSSFDNHFIRISVRDEWKRVKQLDFLMGDFRWTGFDYLGESRRKGGWPARTDNYGIIDLAGFPKDHYYLYQSLWTDEPMVHILPHWTHPGKEGETIPVVAYTNAESAELFLNGESLGRKPMTNDLQIVWKVPYQPGILKVNAYNKKEQVASDTVRTVGNPSQIRVEPDRKVIKANQRDLVHLKTTILDRKGTLVPNADDTVHFNIKGPARLLGVENGDILDVSPHTVQWRKAFKGKCLLVIQATNEKGTIVVEASANGLKSGQAEINVR